MGRFVFRTVDAQFENLDAFALTHTGRKKFSKFVLYKLYKMKLTKKAKIELDDIGFIGSQEKLSKAEQKKIDEATSSFIKALKKKRSHKQLSRRKISV